MTPRVHRVAALVTGAALLLAVATSAQPAAPAAPTPSRAPAAPTTAPAAAAPAAAAPAGAAPPGAPAAASSAGPAEAKPTRTRLDGYTWDDKARPSGTPAKRRLQKKFGPDTPIVTYPGFRLLPDGRSLVWVTVNREVPVRLEPGSGRVTFLLEGAHVQVWNNTHALLTSYFASNVAAVELKPSDAGARLVIEFREAVSVTHSVVKGPQGQMVLRVEVPKLPRMAAAAAAAPPTAAETPSFEPEPKPAVAQGRGKARAEARAEARASASMSADVRVGSGKKKKK